jgi:hypothetical protein
MTKPVTTTRLTFHPAADIFPPMEGTEFDELVADIKANGLKEPVVLYDGKLLDGRNRARACSAAGIPVTAEEHHEGCARIGDPFAYVVSKNFHRRHLDAKQKRDVLVKLVAAQPTKSDRTLAREAKVDHHQISRARRKAEATGTVVPVKKRTGADGKSRKQPAKKKTDAAKRAAEYRAAKERREHEDIIADVRARSSAQEAEAEQIAVDLLEQIDQDLAQRLHAHLGEGMWLKAALGRGLGLEGQTADDDGLDIPEYLKRVAP